jgi:transposase
MDGSKQQPHTTAGWDLGDKYSYLGLIDTKSGEVLEQKAGCAPPQRGPKAALLLRAASYAYSHRGGHPLTLG